MKTLLMVLLMSVATNAADVIAEMRTSDGKVYKQVRVTKVDAAEIRFIHADGITSLPLSVLPNEVLARYGVDADPTAERKAARWARPENDTAKAASVKPQEVSTPDEQQRRAAHYAEKTGKSIDLCLQAVRVGDWCVANPKGGIGLDGKHYDAAAAAEQLHLAMQILGMVPADDSPPAVSAQPARRMPQAGVAVLPAAGGRVIESSIDGEFTGFEGERVFKLLNGQVWQQTDFYYWYHYAYGPRVMIYQAGGGWMMKVDGVEKPVRVQMLR